VKIEFLYHWSPAERYASISQSGLVPFSPPVVSSVGTEYVCLGVTPSAAWGLSGAMEWASEIEAWDLWQVRIGLTDEVHYRSDFGPYLKEVRVANTIPPERMWYCGRRTIPKPSPEVQLSD
jgi:hypothetical protein